jgi:hypothetical protein
MVMAGDFCSSFDFSCGLGLAVPGTRQKAVKDRLKNGKGTGEKAV